MSRRTIATVALLALAGPVDAKPAQAPATSEGPSTAVTPAIIDAIAEEMDRAMARLALPDAPGPFHILSLIHI